MSRERPVALVDLDGSVADFDGAMERGLRSIAWPAEHVIQMDESRALNRESKAVYDRRRDLIKQQPGFWENLPVLDLGMEIVEVLDDLGFEKHILTKGPIRTTGAWTEKVRWVHRIFGPDTAITITHDKGLVYGRVLVDDWPKYIEAWLAYRPRGFVVMPAQPWNKDAFADNPQVMRYDGSHRPQLHRALENVRDRKPV